MMPYNFLRLVALASLCTVSHGFTASFDLQRSTTGTTSLVDGYTDTFIHSRSSVSMRLQSQEQQSSFDGTSAADDDEEFHPSDPARTTPQFLSGLWQLIARGNNLVR